MLAITGWALCGVFMLAEVATVAGLAQAHRDADELRAIAAQQAQAIEDERRDAFWMRQRMARAEAVVRAWTAAGPLGVASAASRPRPASRPLSGPLTRDGS